MDTRALGMAVVAMGGGPVRHLTPSITASALLIWRVWRPGRRSASAGGYPRERRKQLQEAAKAVKAAIKLADKAPETHQLSIVVSVNNGILI